MSIPVTCPKCRTSFRVKDEWAGKKGKCPQCKALLEVPAPPESDPGGVKKSPVEPGAVDAGQTALSAAGPEEVEADAALPAQPAAAAPPSKPAAQNPAELAQEVLLAFQGEIEPVAAPVTYKFGIFLVAVVMVLLPLLYVALIALACYLIYFHAIHDTALLGMGRGRARGFFVLLYFGPILAGGILVLFMIKPLFARPAKDPKKRSLSRQNEGLLFAFVDRVCAAVRAPNPMRIDVDCEVNASASFRRGLLSMLGSDLVLTIGLPLVAGLSLRQFAGVLAHEFGHFAQGAGMRLTYVIRSISWWFTRVVYERDVWDERLVRWAQDEGNRLGPVFQLARLFVWLTRRILWVLMMIGHAVSGLMLRQMELDADRHEARVAGSDVFESTCRQLMVLNVANHGAQADLKDFYKEGRLGDDLPRLILVNVGQLPREAHAKMNELIDESTTGLLDTHPADKDRIANARRENAQGIFHLDRPASVLFSDFQRLSKEATLDFFAEAIGPEFNPSLVHPLDDLLARQSKDLEGDKALGRYFQGMFHVLRPLPVLGADLLASATPREAAARLKEARRRMLESKPEYDKAYALFDEADTLVMEAGQAGAMLRANLTVKPDDFHLRAPTASAADGARSDALARQQQASPQLAAMERAAADRIFAALELLEVPQVAAKIEDLEERQSECKRIVPALQAVCGQFEPLFELRNEQAALGVLLGNLEGNEENQSLVASIQAKMESLHRRVQGIRDALSSATYPFDHAKGKISIAEYLVPEMPFADDLGAIFGAGEAILETLPTLYARMVGRLAVTAEQVEESLGLARLKEPAAEKPAETSPGAAEKPS